MKTAEEKIIKKFIFSFYSLDEEKIKIKRDFFLLLS